MEKIKFIADTACDIPDEMLLQYGIAMPSVPITIDGQGYFERKSFTIHEFYRVLAQTSEIPATSRVPLDDYCNCYLRAYEKGFTDVISVTINGSGSGTNASSQMAAEFFFKEHPNAKGRFKIHIIDSKTYTMAYGYPVVNAAKMARAGKTVAEIIAYLEDWFDTCEIYLACYTLEYAKKSGRISAAAAVVGDVLGVRPIISLIDGQTKTVVKIRGEKQIIPQLMACYENNCDDFDAPVLAVCGAVQQYGLEVQQALQNRLKRDIPLYNAGASIVINAGPRIAAVVCRGKKRPRQQNITVHY